MIYCCGPEPLLAAVEFAQHRLAARLAARGAVRGEAVMRSLLFQNGAQGDLRLVAKAFRGSSPSRWSSAAIQSWSAAPFPATTPAGTSSASSSTSDPISSICPGSTESLSDPLGRFAQNPDADQATAEYGEQVVEAQIARIGELVNEAGLGPPDLPFLAFDDVEPAWAPVERQRPSWVSYGQVSG